MPSPLPYRNHYHGDWITSGTVRQMSFAAEGIYHALLDLQWEEEALPADSATLKRLLMKVSSKEWKEFEPYLEKCFPICEDGMRRNARCDTDRKHALAKVQTNRENAQRPRGERSKKPEETGSERLATAKRTQSERLDIKESESDIISIPVGEIVSVETPLVNFDALDPFGIAESVLVGASQAIGGSPPTPEEVRRYCAKSSPVQLLAAKYGVRKSVAIAVYAMTVRTGIGWKGIWEGSMAFEKQMVDGIKSQYGAKKPEIMDVLAIARQAAGVA